VNILGAGFILILTISLAGLAQYYKVLSEKLAESLLAAHAWVDEIIEALEDKDEAQGNRAVDRLVAQRRDDERPGSPEH
jgi:hypothetical protein